MEKSNTYKAALIAAACALLSVMIMALSMSIPESGVDPQPVQPDRTAAEFLSGSSEDPDTVLLFFTADSFFVLSYLMVFAGLYIVQPKMLYLLIMKQTKRFQNYRK